ncbi:MAG TPA: Fur family transcriptional regulator [Actinomycetota bacterium]|nr:Fur family transcriptional regulator [Actinomycetota bacterium]
MTERTAWIEDLHREAASRLGTVGQRYTANRRTLIEVLAEADRPLTVSAIVEGRAGLPVSSAYRNLAVLERAGLVRRVLTDEEHGRYELAEELTDHHHHLVCSSCGTVEDVTFPPNVERSVGRTLSSVAGRSGFTAVAHRLDVVGLCRACA